MFNVDKNGSASLLVENLPVDTEMKALAVTLEPKGGVAAPTGGSIWSGPRTGYRESRFWLLVVRE